MESVSSVGWAFKLIFALKAVSLCHGLPCSDEATAQELQFICRFEFSLYIFTFSPDSSFYTSTAAPYEKLSTKVSTGVIVNHYPQHETALFLTAAHGVEFPKPYKQEETGTCKYVNWNARYLKEPFTEGSQLSNHVVKHGAYANISIDCFDNGSRRKLANEMYGYAVELNSDEHGIPVVTTSRVRKYRRPKGVDIAVVVAKTTQQFRDLVRSGNLNPISMPPENIGNFLGAFNDWQEIDGKSYRIVRAGGFGHSNPAQCNFLPFAPSFANFGIQKFRKLKYANKSTNNPLHWRTWPFRDDDVYMNLKVMKCTRKYHTEATHGASCGRRSLCEGDSGGPVFLPSMENPILIGVTAESACTHNKEVIKSGGRQCRGVTSLVTSTFIREWYNKIKLEVALDHVQS